MGLWACTNEVGNTCCNTSCHQHLDVNTLGVQGIQPDARVALFWGFLQFVPHTCPL